MLTGGFKMLKSLQVKFKDQILVFSAYELMQIVVDLMQTLENEAKWKPVHLEPTQSALEASKFNIMRNPSDWLGLAKTLEDKQPDKENTGKIGYRIGGRHIVFINHADRFAFDYGKYQALEIVLTKKILENPEVQQLNNLVEGSEEHIKKAQEILLYIVIGFMTVRLADQKLLKDNTVLDIKKGDDSLINPNKTPEQNPDKLGYLHLYKEITKSFSSQPLDDIKIAKQIRALLKGSQDLSIVNSLELPVLVAALFISEVARNRTCFLSGLFLLDFIENKIEYGKQKKYTWKNVLWDPDTVDGIVAGNNAKLKASLWGGKHPMTHDKSFSREFSGDIWRLDENLMHLPRDLPIKYLKDKKVLLGTARQKEASLLIRWLFHKIDATNMPQISKEYKSEGANDLKKVFVENYIKPLLLKRLADFDNQLSPSVEQVMSTTTENSGSSGKETQETIVTGGQKTKENIPFDLMIFGASKAELAKHIDEQCVELERITDLCWQIRQIHTYDLGGGEQANIKMYAAKIDDKVRLLSIKEYLKSKLTRRSILIFNQDNLLIIRGNLSMDELQKIDQMTQAPSIVNTTEKVLAIQ